jgi:hypothetical protein
MYDPAVVLQGIDDHVVPYLLLSVASFAGLFLWYYEAIRIGERDRAYSMPVFITFTWLAHDATFVARYSDWFGGPYDHWVTKLYWVAMLCTSLVEVFFVIQLLRLGRPEIAPRTSQTAFSAGVLLALAGTWSIWLMLKDVMSDDLFQVSFALTAACYPGLGLALLLRRRSRRGQTVRQWIGFTTAVGFWFIATLVAYGPSFRSWQWIALALTTVVWGSTTTVLVARPTAAGPVAR